MEKSMVSCVQDFGVAANPTISYENFDFLERAVKNARRLHIRGDQQQASKDEVMEKIVLGSDIATTTHEKTIVRKIRIQ